MPDSYAEASDGTVLIANGIDPVLRWDGFSASVAPAGMTPPATAPALGVAATGGTITGTFVAFYSYVAADGTESSLSPASDPFQATDATSLDYYDLPPTAPEGAVSRRLWRTTDGQRRVAYLDVESTDVTAAAVTSTQTDADLRVGLGVPLLDDDNLDLTRANDPPPDTKPFLAEHLNTVFLAGVEPYSEGSVFIKNGDTQVVGAGTAWRENFAGRFLYAAGAEKAFEIESVDETTQTITLVESWAGVDNPFAGYAIRPAPAEENLLYFSQAGRAVYWPATFGIELPQDGDVVTGLMPMGSFMYVLKRCRSWRYTGLSNPLKDGFLFPAADRGCVNHRSFVVIGSQALLLDERGVYAFDGSGVTAVSESVQDYFRPDGPRPINWSAARYFHAVNDPTRDTVRFFVCLRGDYLPRHALAYNHKLGRWWVEEYPYRVGCSTLGWTGRPTATWRLRGEAVYLGTAADAVLALGKVEGDGAVDGRGPAVVVSAGPTTVTVSPPPADDTAANFPVTLAGGAGRGQTRLCVAVASGELTLDRPWRIKPAVGDVIVVGGVPYQFRTKEMDVADTEVLGERGLMVDFRRAPGETMAAKYRFDTDEAWLAAAASVSADENYGVAAVKDRAERDIDLGKKPPRARLRFDGAGEAFTDTEAKLELEFTGVSAGTPHAVHGLTTKGVVR